MRQRIVWAIAGSLCALMFSVATAGVQAAEVVAGPPRIKAARWRAATPKPGSGPKTLTIIVEGGYCVGEPRPRIDHIQIVERRPSNARPYKSAVITAYVEEPRPREVVGEVGQHEPGKPILTCAGLGWDAERRIKLKRPSAQLRLFDGSASPPRAVAKANAGQ